MKATLASPITVQPQVDLSEVTIQRLVFLPEQKLWRIFTRELPFTLEIKEGDAAFASLPTFNEAALTKLVSEGTAAQVKLQADRKAAAAAAAAAGPGGNNRAAGGAGAAARPGGLARALGR